MRGSVVTAVAGLVLVGCAQRPTDTGTIGTPPVITSVTVSSMPVPPDKLSPRGRTALDRAERDGVRSIGLTVSTEPGRADEVAATMDRLGATVETTDAGIGYVRVTVPVELVAKVTAVEGISRVDVDEPLGNGDPTP
ncbi:hypothetical protein FHX81_5357 [Saccharothrix saharensis]|uniref:Putative peptidase inhibitor domain-containing protein n=1 Tax=Saccharothrix saharensis TaxID=571190 RepID=A0A543JJF1_9PSEU|nr:hypothetical protein [Saccharothrix saharensis]TQM82945.1 hypothetical protein FHX81_5357 [Saccharothrix saharensis]